jgi:hypothetical protein
MSSLAAWVELLAPDATVHGDEGKAPSVPVPLDCAERVAKG